MQRAASSDTLSTMAFSNADAQSHNSQHDVKQQLSHSQSLVLPENGKVFTSRARTHKVTNCVHSRETHREKRKCMKTNKQTSKKLQTYAHIQIQTIEHSWWCPLPAFQQCRDYSFNVANIVVEPPSPQSSPDSDGCTPVRKPFTFDIKSPVYECNIKYSFNIIHR